MASIRTVFETDRLPAEHQVQLAMTEIAARHRLLGTILAGMLVQVTDAGAIVSASLRGSRLALSVNAAWAVNVTLPEVEGGLIHEVNHLLLGHHEIDGTGLDAALLNIAMDVTANEYSDRPAPTGTATLADYPAFPPGESVLERYGRLHALQAQAGDEPEQAGDDGGEENGANGDNKGDAGPADGSGEEAGGRDGNGGSGGGQGEDGASQPQATTPGPETEPTGSPTDGIPGNPGAAQGMPASNTSDGKSDAHASEPSSAPKQDASLSVNCLTVQAILAAAGHGMQVEDLSELEQGMLVQVQESTTGCGDGTAGAYSWMTPSFKPGALVSWRPVLRRYVGEAMPVSRPSYARPSRRFPNLLGIVPGKESRPGKPVIMAVIDTSGSMEDDVLSDIVAELRILARGRRVIVVQCDSEVQSVERFSGHIDRCSGRGGTNFHPIFEPDLLRRTKAELIIVFSDGCGPAPEKAPRVPVIWALTAPHNHPATWGDVIHIPA